mgnify:FL=1
MEEVEIFWELTRGHAKAVFLKVTLVDEANFIYFSKKMILFNLPQRLFNHQYKVLL